jgi:hypothetical protein
MRNIELTGYKNAVTSTVQSFLTNLPELLGALATTGENHIALCEFEDKRYVQFWSDSNGHVIGEVISNLNIGDLVALMPVDEEQLLKLGFSEPVEYLNPNWTYEATNVAELIQLLKMMTEVLTVVLGEAPGNPVEIQTWEMNIPEDTCRDMYRAETRVYIEESGSIPTNDEEGLTDE